MTRFYGGARSLSRESSLSPRRRDGSHRSPNRPIRGFESDTDHHVQGEFNGRKRKVPVEDCAVGNSSGRDSPRPRKFLGAPPDEDTFSFGANRNQIERHVERGRYAPEEGRQIDTVARRLIRSPSFSPERLPNERRERFFTHPDRMFEGAERQQQSYSYLNGNGMRQDVPINDANHGQGERHVMRGRHIPEAGAPNAFMGRRLYAHDYDVREYHAVRGNDIPEVDRQNTFPRRLSRSAPPPPPPLPLWWGRPPLVPKKNKSRVKLARSKYINSTNLSPCSFTMKQALLKLKREGRRNHPYSNAGGAVRSRSRGIKKANVTQRSANFSASSSRQLPVGPQLLIAPRDARELVALTGGRRAFDKYRCNSEGVFHINGAYLSIPDGKAKHGREYFESMRSEKIDDMPASMSNDAIVPSNTLPSTHEETNDASHNQLEYSDSDEDTAKANSGVNRIAAPRPVRPSAVPGNVPGLPNNVDIGACDRDQELDDGSDSDLEESEKGSQDANSVIGNEDSDLDADEAEEFDQSAPVVVENVQQGVPLVLSGKGLPDGTRENRALHAAFGSFCNIGNKNGDRLCLKTRLGFAPLSLVCLFDGHGPHGSTAVVSDFLAANCDSYMRECIEELGYYHMTECVQSLVTRCEAELFLKHYENRCEQDDATTLTENVADEIWPGSAAVCVVLHNNSLGQATWTVGNAGDCRVIISRGIGNVNQITRDQNTLDYEEVLRVESVCPGAVSDPKGLLHMTTLTRMLGGIPLKEESSALSYEPEIFSDVISAKDEFIIVATDGVFDSLSNEEAVEIVRESLRTEMDPKIAAEKLTEAAREGTLDDCSAVVILLNVF